MAIPVKLLRKYRENNDKFGFSQQSVLRNGGISPAETAVQI